MYAWFVFCTDLAVFCICCRSCFFCFILRLRLSKSHTKQNDNTKRVRSRSGCVGRSAVGGGTERGIVAVATEVRVAAVGFLFFEDQGRVCCARLTLACHELRTDSGRRFCFARHRVLVGSRLCSG